MGHYRGEDGNGDFADRPGAEAGLEHVAEHVDAGADLGDAGNVAGEHYTWRRPGADGGARDSGPGDPFRRPDSAGPFLLGDGGYVVFGPAVIRMPGVGQHARELRLFGRRQGAGDVQKVG